MKTRALACVVLLAFCFGCSTARQGLQPQRQQEIIAGHEKAAPLKFEAVHSMVISIKPHWWWPAFRQVAIGYSRVDRQASSSDVTCLSPLGMKLFSISVTNGQASGMFLLPAEGKQDIMVRSTADAVHRAYFDTVPAPNAKAAASKRSLSFEKKDGEKTVRHTFSTGQDIRLLSKEYFERNRRTMTITYDEYPSPGKGAALPGKMVIKDHRYGYRMEFRLRQCRDVTN